MSAIDDPLPTAKTQDTESISFRLNVKDMGQLRNLAAERKESLNSLVAQIIDRYLKLWIFDHAYGFFPVSTGVLRKTLSKLNDKEIQVLAGEAALKTHRGIIMNLYGKITKDTVMIYLDLFCTRFESYKHFRDGKRNTLTVFHDVDSMEFSKLYYEILSSVLGLAKIEAIDSERDIGTNNFAISFDGPS
jgi:hypothetical protein